MWSASGFWSRCHTELHYRCSMFHRCFQLTDGRTVWRCKAPQLCLILLEMVQRWKCSWFCRGILLWSWKWEAFPYQSQFHHPTSGWAESLEDNHNFLPLFERHRELNQRVLPLLCSVLWPSCFQHRFDLGKINKSHHCSIGNDVETPKNFNRNWL